MQTILMAAAVSLTAAVGGAPPSQRLAVLEIRPLGVPPELAHTLTGVVAEQAGKIPGFTAISQSEITSMLGLERQKQMLGCGDESCLAEIGGALGASRVLSGSLSKVGDAYLLQLELVDTTRAVVQGRESRSVPGAATELIETARDLTHRLLTGKPLDVTGRIKFTIDPSGARVVLDGRQVGKSPLANSVAMDQGRHKIQISADGYVTYETTMEVVPGQELAQEISLVPTSAVVSTSHHETQRVIGYVALGIAAAALGAGIYEGVQANKAYDNYQSAIYKQGNGSTVTGAQTYQQNTQQYANVANACFLGAAVVGVFGLVMEVWGLSGSGSSEPAKRVEVTGTASADPERWFEVNPRGASISTRSLEVTQR
jgi:hypothetical protein